MRNKLYFALAWCIVSAGLLFGVFWLTGKLGERFYHDFRGQPLPARLRPFGPQAGLYVKPEADGLRIALPKKRKEQQPVGVSLMLPVSGDFEITTTVEILQADEPAPSPPSFGVGILMTVDETTRMGRLDRVNGQKVMIWDQWLFDNPEEPKLVGGSVSCESNIVQLRMKRTGSALAYLWASGSEDEFHLIHEGEFRTDDIKEIKVMAETGTQPCALEVRFLDLRVTGNPGVPPLFWWLGTAAVIVTGGVLGWRWVPVAEPLPAKQNPTPADKSTLPVEAIVVKCPGCTKTLRVSAKDMSKKLQCPNCKTVISI